MVYREKGESGDESYRISARLVHATILTIIGAMVSLGGYMTVWALNDATATAIVNEKLTNHTIRITELERDHAAGILPIAKERLEQLERRMRDMEARERR